MLVKLGPIMVQGLLFHFHEKSGHSGRDYVLVLLRERFWFIRAHFVVRSVLSSCIACKKRHASPGEQKMADLPPARATSDQPPFNCVRVDYFGPFLVRQKRIQVNALWSDF